MKSFFGRCQFVFEMIDPIQAVAFSFDAANVNCSATSIIIKRCVFTEIKQNYQLPSKIVFFDD